MAMAAAMRTAHVSLVTMTAASTSPTTARLAPIRLWCRRQASDLHVSPSALVAPQKGVVSSPANAAVRATSLTLTAPPWMQAMCRKSLGLCTPAVPAVPASSHRQASACGEEIDDVSARMGQYVASQRETLRLAREVGAGAESAPNPRLVRLAMSAFQ